MPARLSYCEAMEFWDAYSKLRVLCPRAEEIAVGAEVSVSTVKAWDLTAEGSKDKAHKRNPSFFNRVRLSRFAETKGAQKKIVEALKPDATAEARA